VTKARQDIFLRLQEVADHLDLHFSTISAVAQKKCASHSIIQL